MSGSCTLAWGVSAAFAVAFLAARGAYGRVLRIARAWRVTDDPCARKLQREPVPVLGGVAVACGIAAAVAAGEVFFGLRELLPPACAMAAMLCAGVADDVRGLSPWLRLAAEAAAVLCLACMTGLSAGDFHGLWGVGRLPDWIALPLTVFAGAGIINSINMIDGVNGLCSGYCVSACAAFGAFFCARGDAAGAFLASACAGALIPFLLHNVFGRTSRMFIGDGGTMLMGTAMTYFVISAIGGGASPEGLCPAPFCLSALAVPVFDTVRVMAVRTARRKSPFRADKAHLHHRLLSLGFSHAGAACAEILLNGLAVGAWGLSYALGASADAQLYAAAAAGFCATFGVSGLIDLSRRRPGLRSALLRLGGWTRAERSRWFLKVREILDR